MATRLTYRWIAPKDADYPFSPFVHIVPASYGATDNGDVLLTPQCVTPTEVEEQVDQMIADLIQIKRETRRKFLEFRPPPRIERNN